MYVIYYCRTYDKAVRGEEGDEGRVLWDNIQVSLCDNRTITKLKPSLLNSVNIYRILLILTACGSK